ncbi:Glucan endo-1,3-beta-glucosidase 1, partial [Linum perenne]
QDKEPFVGFNLGTDVSNFLSPADLVSFLQLQKINHLRLYDANPDILKALAKTKIRVVISVPNNQLLGIGSSNVTAASWISRNVAAYYPRTLITGIAVGDENLNITDVVVLVMESGWPSKGDSKEPYATVDNADMYNSNLIKHVLDRSGTPLHPEVTSNVYIYELFNEDLRSSPVSEANWGLFYGNSTSVYLLHVSGSGTFMANDSTNQTYCIAMDDVDGKTLQAALDWVCGPGKANCSEVQPGEACYQPNNVKNHASYAFDSYYQKEGKSPGSCDFKGVGMITTTDPSKRFSSLQFDLMN